MGTSALVSSHLWRGLTQASQRYPESTADHALEFDASDENGSMLEGVKRERGDAR